MGEENNLLPPPRDTPVLSWLTSNTRFTRPVPRTKKSCSFINALNHHHKECGPMHNVIVALPNIGGALCSAPQSLAEAQYN